MTELSSCKCRQHGGILPLVAVGMLVMVGVAGLAIDSSHAFVNVTRMQNALDAAALSAAKSLQIHDRNTAVASNHGAATFVEHLEGEMGSGVTVAFEFSNTLDPFVLTTVNANYVRATSTNHTIGMWFARVLPGVGDTWTIGSTAVAGPSPLAGGQVCDIAPLLVCGDPADPTPDNDTLGGLPIGDGSVQCLKFGAGTNAGNGGGGNGNGNGGKGGNGNGNGGGGVPAVCADQFPDDPDGVGPGNYHLLRLGGSGGNVVRDNLAGGFNSCVNAIGPIDTQPGNLVGPVSQGLNTRFGIYQGSLSASDFPPDLVTDEPLTHSQYAARYRSEGPFESGGEEFRRVLAVPIADCDGIQNGQSTVNVFALGCYFIQESIGQGGQNNYIVGELIDDCSASGIPGDTAPSLGGPEIIQLYNDPGNPAT